KTIKICTKYKLSDGSITETVPYELVNEKIEPIYTEVKGWNTSLENITNDHMPVELADYIRLLETALNVPITLLSTGPDRKL
ncbi:MAG: adenylosuccinate synthetase, partial [Cyclobacteriaceae bacterium]